MSDEPNQNEPVPTGRVLRSPTIAKLADALAKAQSAIKAAAKDSENPHFRSKYADLASVWEACREPLTSHGLSVVQLPFANGQRIGVTTILLHSSGEWLQSEVEVQPQKADAQGAGSAITYLRRYSLAAVASVAPDDDDGNAASGRGDSQEPQRRRQPQKSQPQKPHEDKPKAPAPAEPLRTTLVDVFGKPPVGELDAVVRHLTEGLHGIADVGDAAVALSVHEALLTRRSQKQTWQQIYAEATATK